MALSVYPPLVIVNTILKDFFPYRGLTLVPRGLARDAPLRAFAGDEIISDMEQFYYVRLDATRATPRGGRDWVVVLVLAAGGKYAHHSPDLRKLLEGVGAERASKEGRLDELIVVAEEEFFKKKNLTDVVRELQDTAGAQGVDPDGLRPFYNAFPYYNFAFVVPENQSVGRHRIMAPEEVEALLRHERLPHRNCLPIIFTGDAPLVWLGAREDQVVEITHDSQTAAIAIGYRYVKRGSIAW